LSRITDTHENYLFSLYRYFNDLFLLSGCGVNLKMPSDFKVKADIGANADGIADDLRSAFNKKVNPKLYVFLKDGQLVAYIQEQAKRYNAQCMIPTRDNVDIENQGSSHVFDLTEYCYAADNDTGNYKEYSFNVSGSVDTKTFAYDFMFEAKPEVTESTISADAFDAIEAKDAFLPVAPVKADTVKADTNHSQDS
jgi:hypothetical protein